MDSGGDRGTSEIKTVLFLIIVFFRRTCRHREKRQRELSQTHTFYRTRRGTRTTMYRTLKRTKYVYVRHKFSIRKPAPRILTRNGSEMITIRRCSDPRRAPRSVVPLSPVRVYCCAQTAARATYAYEEREWHRTVENTGRMRSNGVGHARRRDATNGQRPRRPVHITRYVLKTFYYYLSFFPYRRLVFTSHGGGYVARAAAKRGASIHVTVEKKRRETAAGGKTVVVIYRGRARRRRGREGRRDVRTLTYIYTRIYTLSSRLVHRQTDGRAAAINVCVRARRARRRRRVAAAGGRPRRVRGRGSAYAVGRERSAHADVVCIHYNTRTYTHAHRHICMYRRHCPRAFARCVRVRRRRASARSLTRSLGLCPVRLVRSGRSNAFNYL